MGSPIRSVRNECGSFGRQARGPANWRGGTAHRFQECMAGPTARKRFTLTEPLNAQGHTERPRRRSADERVMSLADSSILVLMQLGRALLEFRE
jgi:hypothetical protein